MEAMTLDPADIATLAKAIDPAAFTDGDPAAQDRATTSARRVLTAGYRPPRPAVSARDHDRSNIHPEDHSRRLYLAFLDAHAEQAGTVEVPTDDLRAILAEHEHFGRTLNVQIAQDVVQQLSTSPAAKPAVVTLSPPKFEEDGTPNPGWPNY